MEPAPVVLIVESTPVLKKHKAIAVEGAGGLPVMVPAENPVMHIQRNHIEFDLLITDNAGTVQTIRQHYPDVFILGIISGNEERAFMAAGATHCIPDILNIKALKKIVEEVKKQKKKAMKKITEEAKKQKKKEV